jgi:hypothetical protein
MVRTTLCLAALLCLAACDDAGSKGGAASAKPSAKPVASAAQSAAGSAKGPTAPAADDPTDKEDIPVAEDFEEEAEKAINDENLDEQVDKLDKEIVEDKE